MRYAAILSMPKFMQKTYICPVCFQVYFELNAAWKHYDSSHGDAEVLGSCEKGKMPEGDVEHEE